ncbi:MAG TPA: homocysteine S-methyltransferase family protein [Coriobacteriia bacterium]
MPDILSRLGREVLVVDGAMGTMLQRAGMPSGQCPEELNVTNPEMVLEVHHAYITVGAECISTNTFGGTRPKLAEFGLGDRVEELNRAGVRLARRAGAQHILGDVGPCGLVMEPLGPATFDQVFAIFVEQITALVAESPDAIAFETFTDLAEIRCALLAARSVTDLPLIASMTFGLSGRTELSATDPETAAVVLEACGATVVGMNCGLGPEQMLPLVSQMAAATSLPLVVQPNAGLPTLVNGQTVFPGTADEMGRYAARFAELGAALVGSCCGSSPSFTGAILDEAKRVVLPERCGQSGVALTSVRSTVRIGAGRPLALVGEGINPTGRKALASSLRDGSLEIVRELAVDQGHAGAHMLDVNVGAAGVDAVTVLPRAVTALAGLTELPLVIDTTDPAALEVALKQYPGRALVNSVNGGEASLAAVLPLARRFGAAVVALALDDAGIPATAAGRVAVVERIRAAAHAAGLRDDDIVADCLVLTAATDSGAALTTLEAVTAVHDLGLATVLGISNVSHGLPGRPDLNAAMLALARRAGLDAAIVNPSAATTSVTSGAEDLLLGRDPKAERWIAAWRTAGAGSPAEQPALTPADALAASIDRGDVDAAPRLVDELIDGGRDPREIIALVLTPAIQRLGDAYGRGEVFLPQLMVAADAMKAAVARVKLHLPEGESASAGDVVFATVKGDVHSIGKDICISMLESQGFCVTDLGVDVSRDRLIAASADTDAVCLSALMTTTLPAMESAVAGIKAVEPRVAVLVGGAVVTAQYAHDIGADGYSADAPGCVDAVRRAIERKRQ